MERHAAARAGAGRIAVARRGGTLAVGDNVRAEVDEARRDGDHAQSHAPPTCSTRRCARCSGTHVKQAGSLVAPDRLRFDFTHFAGGHRPRRSPNRDAGQRAGAREPPVVTEVMPIDEALTSGAMALFGEKYGDRSAWSASGQFTTELCGGTHVDEPARSASSSWRRSGAWQRACGGSRR